MEENNQNINNDNKSWWKPVIYFYAKTTSWIVFPLLFAVLGGGYVGKSFESQGLFFLFVIVGFLITCFGIYREIKKYKKNIDTNIDNK